MNSSVEHHGFATSHDVLSRPQVDALINRLGPMAGAGRRGILAVPEISTLARSAPVLDLIRPCFDSEPFPVRAIYFDKCLGANWLVAWHQDVHVAVQARADLPGFGPWSVKAGIPHVQPPVTFLEQMLIVRLHLDAADDSNGALRVLAGSHRDGILSDKQIQDWKARQPEHLCCVGAGDALLMRPLLLHASGRSRTPRHRRLIHLEYAAFSLPAPLQWHASA